MLTSVLVVLSLMAAVLGIAACRNQRKLWWRTQAWRYRDPRANEPSDAALAAGRVIKLVTAGILVAGAVLVNGPIRDSTGYDRRDVWLVAMQAAARLEGRPLENVRETDLWNKARTAVSAAAGDRARFKESGVLSATGLKYEITNTRGEHPVCLTVFADRLPESTAQKAKVAVTTSMTDGRC
ncbi:hypothetical protein OHR68_31135 [Spirillospora sp. NBC_00431]